MPKSSKHKKQFRHYTRKKAQEAVWVVETRNNYFQEVASLVPHDVSKHYEERYTDWKSVPELNVKAIGVPVKHAISLPINTLMLPRLLEECIPIALNEHARWDLNIKHGILVGRRYVYETRLRNTVTNDIIPVELFL